MYKNNSRGIGFMGLCSPLRRSCNLLVMGYAASYYSYTHRYVTKIIKEMEANK